MKLLNGHEAASHVKGILSAKHQVHAYSVDLTVKGIWGVDPLGRTTALTYDSLGNPLTVTSLAGTPQAVTTSLTYEPTFSNVTSIADPLNHVTTMSYDQTGNLTTITDPLGNQSLLTYSALGQVLTAADPLGNTTQFSYDPASNDLISTTDPLNRTTVRSTDDVGRLVGATDPLGHLTRYDYSLSNQLAKVTDPLGNQTLFNYDGDGNLLALTDANGHATQYTYDGLDRVVTRIDPLQNQDVYQYDAAGNLIRFTDRRGKITVYAYDTLNRLAFAGYGAQQTAPTYESSVTYAYDAVSRLTQVVDSITGTIAREYDGLDNLISETTPQGTVAYSYDAAGRRASLSVPGQPDVNYTFDEANRVAQINQNGSTVSFTFDSAGRRTAMTLPNGVTANYSYDNASQLTGLSYATNSGPLGNLTYAYDLAGHRVSVGGTLAQTNLPNPVSITAYNANNQLTTWGTSNLFYDANGNMTSDGTNSFVWNARNKLASMNFTANSFQYDPFGRRQAKTISGTTTNYLYDGANVAQELSGTTPTANLLSGGVDEVFMRTDSSGAANFVTDALGSTLALTNGSGSTVASYTYDPFGNTTQTGTSSNSYQYAGRENDGNGLYFNRDRYYSPTVQRFASEDPIGFAGGINLYSYVSNNPIKFTDPYGHDKNDPWWRTFGNIFVHNFFSISFYVEEYGDGGCLNTFLNGTVAALNPVGAGLASDLGGAGTLAVSPIVRYNNAQAYAAARTNVLGGEGLIFPQKSIPYNKIFNGNAIQTLGEFGWGYLDGALLQGVIDESYAAYKGTCH